MKYNIYVKTKSSTFNILEVNENELSKILDVYKYGSESIFIKGKKYWLEDLFEIQIFTFEQTTIENNLINDEKSILSFAKKYIVIEQGYFGDEWLSPELLEHFGKRVTADFITDDFGYLKDTKLKPASVENYVDPERIDELMKIDDDDFDFTKLIAYLRELNISNSHGLYLSIPPIVRAIIDHVPPIFGKANFADVCGSHGSHSFKESMKNLNTSSRKIADSFLHSQIRKQENLPNKTQINFSNNLDVLLQEIVRIRKK